MSKSKIIHAVITLIILSAIMFTLNSCFSASQETALMKKAGIEV